MRNQTFDNARKQGSGKFRVEPFSCEISKAKRKQTKTTKNKQTKEVRGNRQRLLRRH